jgi:hypothetical protein
MGNATNPREPFKAVIDDAVPADERGVTQMGKSNNERSARPVALWVMMVAAVALTGCGGSDSGGSSSGSTYTVGGTVSGLSGTLVLQNNGGDNLSLTANGTFTFGTPLMSNATYAVTVLTQPTTQNCTVSNGSGTVSNSNITSVTVTCAALPALTWDSAGATWDRALWQ